MESSWLRRSRVYRANGACYQAFRSGSRGVSRRRPKFRLCDVASSVR